MRAMHWHAARQRTSPRPHGSTCGLPTHTRTTRGGGRRQSCPDSENSEGMGGRCGSKPAADSDARKSITGNTRRGASESGPGRAAPRQQKKQARPDGLGWARTGPRGREAKQVHWHGGGVRGGGLGSSHETKPRPPAHNGGAAAPHIAGRRGPGPSSRADRRGGGGASRRPGLGDRLGQTLGRIFCPTRTSIILAAGRRVGAGPGLGPGSGGVLGPEGAEVLHRVAAVAVDHRPHHLFRVQGLGFRGGGLLTSPLIIGRTTCGRARARPDRAGPGRWAGAPGASSLALSLARTLSHSLTHSLSMGVDALASLQAPLSPTLSLSHSLFLALGQLPASVQPTANNLQPTAYSQQPGQAISRVECGFAAEREREREREGEGGREGANPNIPPPTPRAGHLEGGLRLRGVAARGDTRAGRSHGLLLPRRDAKVRE